MGFEKFGQDKKKKKSYIINPNATGFARYSEAPEIKPATVGMGNFRELDTKTYTPTKTTPKAKHPLAQTNVSPKVNSTPKVGMGDFRQAETRTGANAMKNIPKGYEKYVSPGLIDQYINKAPVIQPRPRTPKPDENMLQIIVEGAKSGYKQADLGEAYYNQSLGLKNDSLALEKLLARPEYAPGQNTQNNGFRKAVRGASELAGQIGHNIKEGLAGGAAGAVAGAGIGALAGGAGAIPGAGAGFAFGTKAGAAQTAFRQEAGFAYKEMMDRGIPHSTAFATAQGVGAVNAALEFAQIKSLLKTVPGSDKLLSKITSKATQKLITKEGANLGKTATKVLLDRAVDVVRETTQEVLQEGTTMTGANIAAEISGQEGIGREEALNRLKDTATSSALSFGVLGAPGTAVRTARQYFGSTNTNTNQNTEIAQLPSGDRLALPPGNPTESKYKKVVTQAPTEKSNTTIYAEGQHPDFVVDDFGTAIPNDKVYQAKLASADRLALPSPEQAQKTALDAEFERRLNSSQKAIQASITKSGLTFEQGISQVQNTLSQRIDQQVEVLKADLEEGGVEKRAPIRDQEGYMTGDWIGGFSKNAQWYRDFYAEHDRKPNQKELREIAETILLNGYTDKDRGDTPPDRNFIGLKSLETELLKMKGIKEGIPTRPVYTPTNKTIKPKPKSDLPRLIFPDQARVMLRDKGYSESQIKAIVVGSKPISRQAMERYIKEAAPNAKNRVVENANRRDPARAKTEKRAEERKPVQDRRVQPRVKKSKSRQPKEVQPRAKVANETTDRHAQAIDKALGTKGAKGEHVIASKQTATEKNLTKIGKALGLDVQFFNADKESINGFTDGKNSTTVYIARPNHENAEQAQLFTLGHEFLHVIRLERPDLYQEVLAVYKDSLTKKEINSYRNDILGGSRLSDAAVVEEITADELGNMFHEDSRFWERLYSKNRSLFKDMVEAVRKILTKLMKQLDEGKKLNTATGLDETTIADLRKKFEEIVNRFTVESGKTEQISKNKFSDRPLLISEIDENIIKERLRKKYPTLEGQMNIFDEDLLANVAKAVADVAKTEAAHMGQMTIFDEELLNNVATNKNNKENSSVRGKGRTDDRLGRGTDRFRKAGIRTTGLSFTSELINKGRIDLRNRKINSMAELAAIAQVYRDPRFETVRYFYVKNNKIVAHEGISCQIPSMSKIVPEGEKDVVTYLSKKIARFKADAVYVLHNHPSGNPDPSGADIKMTKVIGKHIPEFRGHVIIDSYKYTEIDKDGSHTEHSLLSEEGQKAEQLLVAEQKRLKAKYGVNWMFDLSDAEDDRYTELKKAYRSHVSNPKVDKLLSPGIPHNLLGTRIDGSNFVEVAGKLHHGRDKIVLMFANAKLELRAIQEVPAGMLNNYDEIVGYLRGRSVEFGASNIFLNAGEVFFDDKVSGRALRKEALLERLIKDGIIVDAISSKQDSLRHHYSPRSDIKGYFNKKVKAKRVNEEQVKYSERPIFYSQLEKTLDAKMPKAAMPAQVLSIIKSGQVKAEEIKWSGIDQWLLEQKGKISKDDVKEFLKMSGLKVEEVKKTEEVKFGVYRTPGGENYAELLFVLPDLNEATRLELRAQADIITNGAFAEQRDLTKEENSKLQNVREKLNNLPKRDAYRSSHWSEKDVLAHTRFDERTSAAGKKVLFLQEIQSDWHQEGRRKGYQNKRGKLIRVFQDNAEWVAEYENVGEEILGEDTDFRNEKEAKEAALRMEDKTVHSSLIPNAPFQKTWHEFVLKRMLRYAAENGFDYMAWANGTQNADLYDLREHVDKVRYKLNDDGTYELDIRKAGGLVGEGTKLSVQEIEERIGKEITQKIVNGDGAVEEKARATKFKDYKALTGLDLKVGGEGMKGFYDKIIPAYLNKYAKKWGGKVEEIKLSNVTTKSEKWEVFDYRTGKVYGAFETEEEAKKYADSSGNEFLDYNQETGVAQQAVPITQAMKKAVIEEGQPLFSDRKLQREQQLVRQIATFAERIDGTFEEAERVVERSVLWIDMKNVPILGRAKFYLQTPERVFKAVMGKDAEWMMDLIIRPHRKNDADMMRWLNENRKVLKSLGIRPRTKDSMLVQKYGEKKISLEALKRESPRNWENIKKASETMAAMYQEIWEAINKALVENGYQELEGRKDYFPHFIAASDKTKIAEQGMLNKYGSDWKKKMTAKEKASLEGIKVTATFEMLGFQISENKLPVDLIGLTEDFLPGKSFFSNLLTREADITTFDAITGADKYLEGAGRIIFHTNDIQRLRKLSHLLRTAHQGTTHLSGLVVELEEYANDIAGKKSGFDRGEERMIGRNLYAFMDKIRTQYSLNTIGINPVSALTNLIPALAQVPAVTNKAAYARALVETLVQPLVRDSFWAKSDFLVRRFGSDRISMNTIEKAINKSMLFFEIADGFASNVVVRSLYYDQLMKKKSQAEAMQYANEEAAALMGDRGRGARPTIYMSKKYSLLTQFQIEVANQLEWYFNDLPHRYSKPKYFWIFMQIAIYSWLFNNLFAKAFGRRPAFDVIGVTAKAWEDYNSPYITKGKASNNLVKNIADQLPFVGSLLGGGRLPISQAFPDLEKLQMSIANEDGFGNMLIEGAKSLKNTAVYMLPPTGGGMIKKAIEGMKAYYEGGLYKEGKLRFPVEQNTANLLRGLMAGQYSFPEAREYFDKAYGPLTEKQTAEIDAMTALGFDKKTIYNLVQTERKSKGIYNKIDDVVKNEEMTEEEKMKSLDLLVPKYIKLLDELKKIQEQAGF